MKDISPNKNERVYKILKYAAALILYIAGMVIASSVLGLDFSEIMGLQFAFWLIIIGGILLMSYISEDLKKIL
jgi:hypothetical protein